MTSCEACRFRKKGQYIQGTGNPSSKNMILDGFPEFPTFEKKEYDLTSDANIYLDKVLDYFKFGKEEYYRTHAVKCGYITKTNKYSTPAQKEIDFCSKLYKEELSLIDPKFVLVLGKTALKQVFGKLSLEKVRGNILNRDGITYIVTYSLEELIDKNEDLAISSKKCAKFSKDVEKFVGLIRGIVKQVELNYELITSEKDFFKMWKSAKETGLCAVDIETNRLEPFFEDSEILSIVFTPRKGENYVLPFSWPGNKYFDLWNYTPQINTLLAILLVKDFLRNSEIKKVFHRGQFDILWLEELLGVKVKNIGDTLVMLALIDSESKKDLKFCAKKYTDLGDYEYDAKLYYSASKVDFTKVPPDVLFRYNAGDGDTTIRIYPMFYKELEKQGLVNLYENFVLPNIRSLIKMQKDGIAIDLDKCKALRKEYEEKMEKLHAELKSIDSVINFERLTGTPFKPTSSKHCMAIAYGGIIKSIEEIPKAKGEKGTKKFVEVAIPGYAGIKPITIGKFIKDEVTGKKNWEKRPSLDKDAVKELFKQYYKGPEYQSKIDTFDTQEFPIKHPIFNFLKPLGLYKTYGTQLSNHLKPFIELWGKSKDKRVHAVYNGTGARTGRLCVSKGTMIEVVRDISKKPKGIPIECVKVGDFVYSYTNKNNLCLKKVKWSGKTGYKKCIKLTWLGQGRHTRGNLILTENHEVRLINGIWKKAKDLTIKDRILALSRTKSLGYSRLHVFGNKELRDHSFIYRQVTKRKAEHTHHIDGNKLNNLPENLEGMSSKEHARLHYNLLSEKEKNRRTNYLVSMDRSKIDYKKQGYNRIISNRPSKFSLLRMLAICGGKPKITSDTYGYDFNTFKRYLKTYDINWKYVHRRYGEDNLYLSKKRIRNVIENLKTIPKVSRELRIGTKYAKELISANNHIITSIENVGYHDVYDLEVEDTHCFIANELCVHNSSSSPNLQNLTRDGFVKEAFCSRWGDEGFLIEADYKMLELFVWAYFSLDKNFTQALRDGIDIHRKVASEMVYNVPLAQITKAMRTESKKFTFGIPYGKHPKTIAKETGLTVTQAEQALANFFKEFPGNKVWMDNIEEFAHINGYVSTLTGRRRQINFEEDCRKAERQSANSPIQGTASDINVYTKRKMDNFFELHADKVVTCGNVHDALWIDSKRDIGKEVIEATIAIMENPGFDWITAPLKVEVKYGSNLRNMREYDGSDLVF